MGNFKENEGKSLDLPEDTVKTFKYFQLWVYTGNILESHETAKDINFATLIDLYLFGEARGIPELQNATMDVLFQRNLLLHTIPIFELPRVYKNTLPNSLLRKAIVDLFVQKLVDASIELFFTEEKKPHLPQDFLIESIITKSKKQGSRHTGCDSSDYHVILPTSTGSSKSVPGKSKETVFSTVTAYLQPIKWSMYVLQVT